MTSTLAAGFIGTWAIDSAQSSMWSVEEQRYLPEQVGEEIIRITMDGDTQDYEVLYGDDPVMRMGYTARFDDPEWVPYLVREIIPKSDTENLEESIENFRQRVRANQGGNNRTFEVGKPYGMVRLVWVDDRTHYRFQRTADGQAQNVMMRKLAEDGKSYLTTLMDRDGIVFRIRVFAKVES